MLKPIQLSLTDNEWEYEYTDHDREIVRAVVFDDEGYLYFVQAIRDDDFGKATLIETSGGGVEDGEDFETAILRELKEELGATAQIVCEIGVVDDYIKLDESFAVKLLKLIDHKGMSDVECYKKANVSKQTWYKINNDKNYKPNKKTVISFAVALKLSLMETQSLLESVGFVLSNSSLFDVIIMYCLSNGIYDVFEIDSILFKYDQETLYSKL